MVPAAVALIPVKGFRHAKERLAPALDGEARSRLARDMATRVVAAAGPLPALVLCDSEDVATWADEVGAETLWCPGTGLNGAVAAGIDELRARGVDRAVVAHSDLPLAGSLAWVVEWPGITIVPDRRRDGSNVIGLPVSSDFRFAYGPGSFSRHLAEAQRLGLGLQVIRHPELGWDVDDPADLEVPVGLWATAAAEPTP